VGDPRCHGGPKRPKSRRNLRNPGNVDFRVGLAPVVALIATLLLGKADYADGGAMDYTTERHTAMTPRLNPYKASRQWCKMFATTRRKTYGSACAMRTR
jgi:hypothetical protein